MFCSECGYKLPSDTMKFCPECGAKIVTAVRKTETSAEKTENPVVVEKKTEEQGCTEVKSEVTDMRAEHTPPMLKPGIPMPVTPSFAKTQQESTKAPAQTGGNAAPGESVPKKKSTAAQFFIGFGLFVLAEFIAMALSGMFFGMESENEPKMLAFVFIFMAPIFVALIGIWKKKPGLLRKGGLTFALFLAMTFGAINDFPEVIRAIQGEDFIGIWFIILVAALILGMLVSVRRPVAFFRPLAEEAKGMQWSDSDIMWLSGFDRYRRTGYYLLKARLHKILVLRVVEAEQTYTCVEINPAFGEAELTSYCAKNPLVGRIVEYIKERQSSEKPVVRVAEIVRDLNVQALEKSPGRIFWHECMEKRKEVYGKADKIFWWCIWGAYCIGIMKLMLGICNEKPVEILVVCFLMFGPILMGIAYWIKRVKRNKKMAQLFIGDIVRYKRKAMKNIDELFRTTDFEADMSEEEKIHLLRAYALYEYNTERYSGVHPKETHFSTALFGAVVSVRIAVAAAQAAARAAAREADTTGGCSGCSGCSSCSSCGGCGGCGGCGD